jgi:hypothetical protein
MLDRAFERLPTSGQAEIDLEARLPRFSSQPVSAKLEGPFAAGAGVIPSFDLDGEAKAAGFGVDGKLVSTGSDAFVVFFGENYRVGPDRVAQISQRAAGLDLRGLFGPPRYGGTEKVQGTDTYRVDAPLEAGGLSAELGIPPGLAAGTIEAWLGASDGLVHRLRIDSGALDVDLTLSDLGEAETIEPPPGGGFKPIEDLLDRIRSL